MKMTSKVDIKVCRVGEEDISSSFTSSSSIEADTADESKTRHIPHSHKKIELAASPKQEILVASLQQKRHIFVCGFVRGHRYHNQTLSAIVQELLTNFYVTVNSSNDRPNELAMTRSKLLIADTLVFFMNGYSLKDNNCITILRCAAELNTPILSVKHPSMKLFISGWSSPYCDEGHSSPPRSSGQQRKIRRGHEEPSHTQVSWQSLHGLLVSTYSQAVPYERLRHDYGICELKRRLLGLTRKFDAMRKSLTVPTMEKPRQRSLSNSNRQLKLPPLSSSYNSTLRSDDSSKKQQGKEPAFDFRKMSISKKKRRKSTKATGRANDDSQACKQKGSSEQDQEEEQQPILPPLETSYSNSNNSKSSHSTDSLNRTSSTPSQLDSRASELNGDAYHGTYYLIFPNMGTQNAAEKPLLIRFPDDVISPADENNSSSRMERELRGRGLIYTLTANDEEEAAVDEAGEAFSLLGEPLNLTSGSTTPLADFLGDL